MKRKSCGTAKERLIHGNLQPPHLRTGLTEGLQRQGKKRRGNARGKGADPKSRRTEGTFEGKQAEVNLDISRLKRAQEAVRASEARFLLLADTAGRLQATQDPQGLINELCRDVMAHLDCQVFFNYLAERHPGPAGEPVPRLHLNAWAGIQEDEARRIEWLDFGVSVCGSVAQVGRPIVAEHIRDSKDPRTVLVKSYGVQAYCCHPLLVEGQVIGTLSFGTTTRRRLAAEEVELMRAVSDQVALAMKRRLMFEALEAARGEALSEKNRLAAVMETLPVGVCILDAQGGIVRTNRAYDELWGGPSPPVRGVSDYVVYEACWAATDKPLQPEEWASARAVQHGETVVNQELRIRRFDGSQAYVLNSAAPIRDGDGRIVGCAVAIRDITDRKQTEELQHHLELQVQQAQKEESLGVLAGGIAHDFNNLLTIIIGNIDLVLGDLSPDSAGRRLLGKAEEASRHAADLCQQMLAYVGKTALSFSPIQLNQLLQDMARLMAASLSKDARLERHLAERLPLVKADPNRVRQILMNLLINASEALGDKPGQITLTTGAAHRSTADLKSPWMQDPLPAGDYVFLEVTDTGCGIDPSILGRIFDPFFTTKFAGRGLGLSAVLGIVRSHHGTIQVESAAGRGSMFRVWLPALAGEAAVAEPARRPARNWRGSGTILVVDDEEAIRLTAAHMLDLLGFETVTANDGVEAVEIYRASPDRFWCVILDATMPRLGGEATFRELVGIRENVRVILSSGYTKDDIMARFAGRGLSGFLQKPYTLENLTEVLQSLSAAREL